MSVQITSVQDGSTDRPDFAIFIQVIS